MELELVKKVANEIIEVIVIFQDEGNRGH
jgi:hypothetical protein